MTGLSPRGRGNLFGKMNSRSIRGSIPAWAGEPGRVPVQSTPLPVYPRVGGGTKFISTDGEIVKGLSPRGRGNPQKGLAYGQTKRSIPAWAGEPQQGPTLGPLIRVYPRVGGGTKFISTDGEIVKGLSPRGRGNPQKGLAYGQTKRSIPAWAGEPQQGPTLGPLIRVYPRVGGGTMAGLDNKVVDDGLSPRGRGNPSGGV